MTAENAQARAPSPERAKVVQAIRVQALMVGCTAQQRVETVQIDNLHGRVADDFD